MSAENSEEKAKNKKELIKSFKEELSPRISGLIERIAKRTSFMVENPFSAMLDNLYSFFESALQDIKNKIHGVEEQKKETPTNEELNIDLFLAQQLNDVLKDCDRFIKKYKKIEKNSEDLKNAEKSIKDIKGIMEREGSKLEQDNSVVLLGPMSLFSINHHLYKAHESLTNLSQK